MSESWPYTVISAWKLLAFQMDQTGVSLVNLSLCSEGKYFRSQVKFCWGMQPQTALGAPVYWEVKAPSQWTLSWIHSVQCWLKISATIQSSPYPNGETVHYCFWFKRQTRRWCKRVRERLSRRQSRFYCITLKYHNLLY